VPGMNSGLNPADPTLVSAFRSALLHQGAIALLIIAFLWLVWASARAWRLTTPGARAAGNGSGTGTGAGTAARAADGAGAGTAAGTRPAVGWLAGWTRRAGGPAEARGRWLLRVGFGVLWILDGILQAQPKMAGGLATQVM